MLRPEAGTGNGAISTVATISSPSDGSLLPHLRCLLVVASSRQFLRYWKRSELRTTETEEASVLYVVVLVQGELHFLGTLPLTLKLPLQLMMMITSASTPARRCSCPCVSAVVSVLLLLLLFSPLLSCVLLPLAPAGDSQDDERGADLASHGADGLAAQFNALHLRLC